MALRAKERAKLLYGAIDNSRIFKPTVLNEEDRSLMNICFVMKDEYKEIEADALAYFTEKGIVGVKGHRSVGGFRASCYNAMPYEGVEALVACMKDLENKY